MTFTELDINIPSTFNLLADATFGRDIARYHQLIEYLTLFSIVLWSCVALTILLRMGVQHIWYRRKQHKAEHTTTAQRTAEESQHGYS